MSRSKGRNGKGGNCPNTEMFWQSPAYTQRVQWMFKKQIMRLALSRFEWVNLPPTCDARYLEWALLTEGQATIAFPKRMPGIFFSTSANASGHPNVYDNPTSWESYGNNGWRFRVDPKNGVMVYENLERMPIWDMIDIYSRELTDIFRTKQVNRFHQKIPMVLKGDQTKYMDMLNIFKQISGYEPGIITTNGVNLIDVEVISTGIAFLASELHEDFVNTWNDIYAMLGIATVPFKTERQIESEVKSYKEPSTLIALDSLSARRAACDRLNRRFERYLDDPIRVVWKQDNESDNYNTAHNIQLMGGVLHDIQTR